jgi:hypothetical protein
MAHGLFAHYSAQNGETYRGLTTIITMTRIGSAYRRALPPGGAQLCCLLETKGTASSQVRMVNVLGTNPLESS